MHGWKIVLTAALTVVPAIRLSAQCPDGGPPPCRQPARAVAPAANTVAILYFAVQDTAVRYLAEGVTEDIATTLGRVERLVVKTPAAVRRIQRLAPGNLRSIGAALGVRFLVDGGVRRVGARYRVTVRLVRAADEVTTWGDTYDRTADQLLEVPAEIASGVATVIGGAAA